jgi:hypothetical protein
MELVVASTDLLAVVMDIRACGETTNGGQNASPHR